MEAPKPGLEGVVVGDTAICCVDQGKLLYRGYPISELAEKCVFGEVAYLLLWGELPTQAQHNHLRTMLEEYHGLRSEVVETIRKIPPGVAMMSVLRTCISMASHFDPIPGQSLDELRRRAVWLLAIASDVIAARFRLVQGKEPIAPKHGLSHAAQMLYMMHGKEPDELSVRILDLTLTLYAEHDFNASTFTSRVVASTASDMTSCIVSAIGALKGPLHGGANEEAIKLILHFKNAAEASAWVKDAIARKEKVMGFGHRVYKHGDHRATILENEMRKLAALKGRQDMVAVYDAIKNPLVTKENPIYPNVDYPCGVVYYLMGLPPEMYTPLFACSRISGWCAHYIEQNQNNRIYRPLSRYTGPALRSVVPIEKR
ncbi:MAG: citrate/2-methylcitrate synthase [Planctomycetota bacterium]